jgi:hypothetical protein
MTIGAIPQDDRYSLAQDASILCARIWPESPRGQAAPGSWRIHEYLTVPQTRKLDDSQRGAIGVKRRRFHHAEATIEPFYRYNRSVGQTFLSAIPAGMQLQALRAFPGRQANQKLGTPLPHGLQFVWTGLPIRC